MSLARAPETYPHKLDRDNPPHGSTYRDAVTLPPMAAPIRLSEFELSEMVRLRDEERLSWAKIASRLRRNEGWLNKRYDALKADDMARAA